MKLYQNTLFENDTSAPLAGATVTVYPKGDATTPATIYAEDDVTSTPIANLLTDAQGAFRFYAPDGSYDLRFDFASLDPLWWRDIEIYDLDELDAKVANFEDQSPDGPINVRPERTVSGTLTIDDANSLVPMNASTPVTLTIPPQADVEWDGAVYIELHNRGTGSVTIAAGSGVTLNSVNDRDLMDEQYGIVGLRRYASDVWVMGGDLS